MSLEGDSRGMGKVRVDDKSWSEKSGGDARRYTRRMVYYMQCGGGGAIVST